MYMIEVTFWPIVAAGIANVLIGWIWYHPRVFGTTWMRLANVTPEMAERGKKMMPVSVIVSFLAAMLVAWAMNAIGVAFGIYDYVGAVVDLALWTWLGFVVPTTLGAVLWEQKPIKLYLINVSYWLVAIVAMAVILVIGGQAGGASYGVYDESGGVNLSE
jgi:hypothetical protein